MTVPEMSSVDEISPRERNARQILPEIARARARERQTLQFWYFFFTTWRNSRSGRQQSERNKENKGDDGILSLYRTCRLVLVAGPAASEDLLLRSMCLKCFNRHGLYDVASPRRANSIHLSADCCLFRALHKLPRYLLRSSATPNATFIDLCKSGRPVIAHNHTRGRYKRESADAHFFPLPEWRESALHPTPQHLPHLLSFFSCPGAASDALLGKRHWYAIVCVDLKE